MKSGILSLTYEYVVYPLTYPKKKKRTELEKEKVK